jgi:LPXTG-motif cell wall-anchored protein
MPEQGFLFMMIGGAGMALILGTIAWWFRNRKQGKDHPGSQDGL